MSGVRSHAERDPPPTATRAVSRATAAASDRAFWAAGRLRDEAFPGLAGAALGVTGEHERPEAAMDMTTIVRFLVMMLVALIALVLVTSW